MGSKTKQVKRGAAKRASPRRAQLQDESPFAEDGRVYRTTTRGVTIECLGIADQIQAQEENIRAQVEWPEPPTYTFEGGIPFDNSGGGGGDTVVRPHTEETIADPKTTPEERQAWSDYKIALAQAEAEFNAKLGEARLRLIAVRGVRIVDYERLEAQWRDDHEWLSMQVPDDPRERLVHFFRFEVVGDAQEDMLSIAKGIYIASGADPEVIASAEATFRSAVGEREGADAGAGAQAA